VNRPDGAHLAFPFHVAPDGRAAVIDSLPHHVRDELMQLLLTNLGERPFIPDLGGGVRRLVFEASSDATSAMAKAQITRSLSRWLAQRLTVQELSVEASNSTLTIDLTYLVAGEKDPRRVRFARTGG
jgi:uncharacterized protein